MKHRRQAQHPRQPCTDDVFPCGCDPSPTDERRVRVAELSAKGHTIHQIAVALDISPRTVVRERKALGMARPYPSKFSAQEHDQVRQWLDDGCSIKEIATTLKRDYHTISDRYPGCGWTHSQCGTYWNSIRKLRQVLKG